MGLFLTLVPFVLFAQAPDEFTGGPRLNLDLSLSPTYPKINEPVQAKVQNFNLNLPTAEISWTLDGVLKQKSIGGNTFNFSLPNSNSHTLGVSVLATDGSFAEKTIAVQAGFVGLVWQANTYTPPFYRGKALPAHQSSILFIAMPESSKSDSNLSYLWEQNGLILGDKSGVGKNSLEIETPLVTRPQTVSVTVSDPTGSFRAQNSLTISTVNPEVVLYQKHPLYGILYENALSQSFTATGNESAFIATPYYFSTSGGTPTASYEWKLNGGVVSSGGANEVTFRNSDSESGQSDISVFVKDISRLLQSAGASFSILFNNA